MKKPKFQTKKIRRLLGYFALPLLVSSLSAQAAAPALKQFLITPEHAALEAGLHLISPTLKP